jgi:Carboxypeptidase regulatory-like domain
MGPREGSGLKDSSRGRRGIRLVGEEERLRMRAVRWLGLVMALGIAFGPVARAQDKNAPAQLRTVHGSVVDKDDNPVSSSVVYLLNVRTQAVKTYIADAAGKYRFSGLDPNVDYEVHAEHDGMASSTRTVSSYDSRRDIDVTLKLSHKKRSR